MHKNPTLYRVAIKAGLYRKAVQVFIYSAGEEKSPLLIFLHDQLPFFLGEIVENFSRKSNIFSR